MNLSEKLLIARKGIESISKHLDVDASVRKAALQKLVDFIATENAEIDAQVAAEVEQLS